VRRAVAAAIAAFGVVAPLSRAQPTATPPSPAVAKPPPRVLLVTLDTTRRDHLGCYGYGAARTPGLDALAARGVVYDDAWCCAPITLASHTTILSGVLPCAHGVRENGAFTVAKDARLVSEVLHDAGFKTGAFVGAFVLDAKFGLDQGFDVYDQSDASKTGAIWHVADRPAGEVAEATLRFVDTLKSDDPFFLWVHFYDPHSPYAPPAEFARTTDAEVVRYDGEIAYCDQQLRRVLDHLRERKLDEGLVVAVTADHGEALGEHGEKTHGVFLYDGTMRVPLIVAPPPAGVAPGSRVALPVSNADLAVTLLERVGLERSLLPDARTPTLPDRDERGDAERALYLECFSPFYSHHWHPLRGLVWRRTKYVETARPELYALGDDPTESHDLFADHPELARSMTTRFEALLKQNAPIEWGSVRSAMSEADRQALQATGYSSAKVTGDPFEAGLVDAKDHVGDLDLVEAALALIHEGGALCGRDGAKHPELTPMQLEQREKQGVAKLEEARAVVLKLRASHAKDPYVDTLLSMVEIAEGNWDAAVPVLERMLTADPEQSNNHYNLATAYLRLGKSAWARREMEKSVHLEPRSLFALRWLVEFALRAKDFPAAAWWLDQIAKAPGQSPAELENVKRKRGQVQNVLDQLHAEPRPPEPITEKELLPEGVR
jgi:arylsulfatase A-like enzyme